jgi:hypothetical protein
MIRRAVAGVVVSAGLVIATPAFAQTPGADTIVLKSGGLYRGTLVDVVPNDHARIRLETGEIANVPWGEIDHVDASDRAPTAPQDPAPTPAPAATPRAAPSPADRVFVHMTGSPDATLEKGNGREWGRVCASPCDKWLPTDGGYRVGGAGIRNSAMFALVGTNGGRVDLDVDPASKSAFVGGIVATSVGYGVLPLGLLLVVVGAVANSVDCAFDDGAAGSNQSCSSSSGNGLLVAGGVTLLVGAVVGTIGVVELASNVHSSVAQSSSTNDRAAPSPVSVRLPAWRETPAPARGLAAAPVAIPLYTLTF